MEPWQQQAQHAFHQERLQQRLPRCQCCERPVTTEFYLDLEPFGIRAVACEQCVMRHLGVTTVL